MRISNLLLAAATAASASALKLTASTVFTKPTDGSEFNTLVNNGEYTPMNLRLVNNEGTAFKVAEVQAALVDPETGARVKVYKPLKVGKSVGKGKTFIQPYMVQAQLPAQRLRLEVELVVDAKPEQVRVTAFNGTVDIVDVESPVVDVQLLFLYTLLAGLFGIAGYFAYTMWEASVAPKKPKRKFETPKPVAPKQEEVEASGAKYEESWIPEHHLKRPGTKAKGGRGKKSIGAGSE